LGRISVGRRGLVASVAGVAEVAASIHINSTILFFSFLIVIFPPFILSYSYMCIFQISDFIFACFQKYSIHEQYAFHQDDVS
jgi:hypothetical protein